MKLEFAGLALIYQVMLHLHDAYLFLDKYVFIQTDLYLPFGVRVNTL